MCSICIYNKITARATTRVVYYDNAYNITWQQIQARYFPLLLSFQPLHPKAAPPFGGGWWQGGTYCRLRRRSSSQHLTGVDVVRRFRATVAAVLEAREVLLGERQWRRPRAPARKHPTCILYVRTT